MEDRGLIARLYYWLDIVGPDGRPANAKLLSTVGFVCAWAVLFAWAGRAENLGSDFVFALILVLGIPYGMDGYKAGLKTKFPGGGGSTLRDPEDEGDGLRPPLDATP